MIIRNILNIKIHPLFYFVLIICFLTGNFRNIMYFTIIIFIHELGHVFGARLFRISVKNIIIYPFGGYSCFNYLVNISLFKELIILISGPLIQIIFTYIIYYLKIDVNSNFYMFSKYILLFNLLPIYPLDGGKLLSIFFSFFISFYNSLKITLIISFFIYFSLLFYFITFKNLIIIIIFIVLGINLYKENKNVLFVFKKFLIERSSYSFNFKKILFINNIYKMKRDYYHIFNNSIYERDYLNKIF